MSRKHLVRPALIAVMALSWAVVGLNTAEARVAPPQAEPTCFGLNDVDWRPDAMRPLLPGHGMHFTGTSGADVIIGTDSDDVIDGLGGNDLLCGMGGSDTINGDGGVDRLDGGSGADQLHGSTENDSIYGGSGSDHLYGEDGIDDLHGDADGDYLDCGTVADSDNDYADGGTGQDYLLVGADCETVDNV
jgi:RTX calcium-binding nonapeptide repeat (4 copies)